MAKSKKQLCAELEALKTELPKREAIGALIESEAFRLAFEDYKEKFSEAIQAEDKKNINFYKKTYDLLIDFKEFLKLQQDRAERIPQLISDIEYDLQQGNLFL